MTYGIYSVKTTTFLGNFLYSIYKKSFFYTLLPISIKKINNNNKSLSRKSKKSLNFTYLKLNFKNIRTASMLLRNFSFFFKKNTINQNKTKINLLLEKINNKFEKNYKNNFLNLIQIILFFIFWQKARVSYYTNNWIYTTNHKRIAINYFWFVILSGIVGMVLATIIRLEFAYPGVGVLAGDSIQYLSLASAHGVIMVFFMIMPLLFGAFANFLLPTQLGVHDVAFPRLNSAAFWFLPGGLLMLCQLVCVDRRYQRMNCFNIREMQALLKRKFFTDLINSKDHHTLLDKTSMGLRFKTNFEQSINGNFVLSHLYGPDSISFVKITNYTESSNSNFFSKIISNSLNNVFYNLISDVNLHNVFFYFNLIFINLMDNQFSHSHYNPFFLSLFKNLTSFLINIMIKINNFSIKEFFFLTNFLEIFSFNFSISQQIINVTNYLVNNFMYFKRFLNDIFQLLTENSIYFIFNLANQIVTRNISNFFLSNHLNIFSYYDICVNSFKNFFMISKTTSLFNFITSYGLSLKTFINSIDIENFLIYKTIFFELNNVKLSYADFKKNLTTSFNENLDFYNNLYTNSIHNLNNFFLNTRFLFIYLEIINIINILISSVISIFTLFKFFFDLNLIFWSNSSSTIIEEKNNFFKFNQISYFLSQTYSHSLMLDQRPRIQNLQKLSSLNNVKLEFNTDIDKNNLIFNYFKIVNNFFSQIFFSTSTQLSFSFVKNFIYLNITSLSIFKGFFIIYSSFINILTITLLNNNSFFIFYKTTNFYISEISMQRVSLESFIKFSSNYLFSVNSADRLLLTNQENSSLARNLKFNNPIFKYDYKSGDYFPKLYKEVYNHLYSSILDLTSGLRTSPWFLSNNIVELINSNLTLNIDNTSELFKNTHVNSTISSKNLNKFFHTDGFYNFFSYLKTEQNLVLNNQFIGISSLNLKFQKMFLTSSLQQRIYANWRQLKFTREAWRCKLLASRHQKTLFKRYVHEDGVFWSIERNAKDLIPGWAMITPFSARTRFTAVGKTDIGLMGVLLVLNSSIVSGANFLVTYRYLSTLNNRKMRDARAFFTEAVMVASWMMILANPMLVIGIIMLLSDRHWQTSFFDYSGGGDTVLFQHMFWFFGHPEVYIIILPTFGFTNTMISYYLKKRVSARASLLYSMYTIAFLGFFVWGHHMYMVGLAHTTRMLFSTLTVMISVPAATKIMHWCVTTVNSSFVMELPLLFTFTFIFFFVSGGISGMCVAHTGMDVLFHDTFYVIGHFHVMLAGGAMFASFGAFYFYFAAIFGVKYSRVYAYLHYTYYLIGQLMTIIPMFWLGYAGMPRRVLDYPSSFGGWHSVISAGHMLNVAGLIAFFVMIFDSLRQARAATRNNFGINRFNTRLNFYIYETSRSLFLQQKTLFLFRPLNTKSLKLNKFIYTNFEPYESVIISYTFVKFEK